MSINTGVVVAALIATLNSAPYTMQEVSLSHTTSTNAKNETITTTVTQTPNDSAPVDTLNNRITDSSGSHTGRVTDSNNLNISADEMATWEALAQCESSGNWSINTGNGYHGGLQFLPSTWTGFGGEKYAPYAYMATKEQQIEIAKKVQAAQGWGAWPACTAKLGIR